MASIPTNPPANPVPGAVYVDITTNTPYVWVGNAWMKAQGANSYNSQITTGATILPGLFAVPPQDTVNQIGSTEPVNPAAGQIWVDQSQTPSPIKIWDGTQWVLIGDGTFTNTFVQTTPPAVKDVGDTFYETTTQLFYVWDGTSWKALNSNDYPSFTAPPVVGPAGDSYFNTTSNTLFVSNGTSWLEVCMAPCAGGTDTHSFTGAGAPTLTQRPDTTALVAGDQYVDSAANDLYYWNGAAWAQVTATGTDTHSFVGTGAPALTQRPDTSALITGDQYIDTTTNFSYYWNGAAWILATTASSASYPAVLSDTGGGTFIVPVGTPSGSAIQVSTGVGGTIILPSIDAENLPIGYFIDMLTVSDEVFAVSTPVTPAAGEIFQNVGSSGVRITEAEIGVGVKGFSQHRFTVALNFGGTNSRWVWTY